MQLTRQHFEFIATEMAPHFKWPTHIEEIADKLAATNPRFNREKFVERAIKAWEANNLPEEINDDYIPY